MLQTQQPVERRVSRRDRSAHYLCRILLYRGPDREVEGTLVTFIEITNLVRVETQLLMIDELNHRMKNMLAVVLSTATQTASAAPSLDAFQVSLRGRLEALGTTYSLLSREDWKAVDLADLVAAEIRPFLSSDGTNISLHGGAIALDAGAAPAGREAWPIVSKPYDPQAVLRLMGSILPHA